MRLNQKGSVFLMIRLAADETANRRIANIEPKNFEGMFRCAQSFLLER